MKIQINNNRIEMTATMYELAVMHSNDHRVWGTPETSLTRFVNGYVNGRASWQNDRVIANVSDFMDDAEYDLNTLEDIDMDDPSSDEEITISRPADYDWQWPEE